MSTKTYFVYEFSSLPILQCRREIMISAYTIWGYYDNYCLTSRGVIKNSNKNNVIIL